MTGLSGRFTSERGVLFWITAGLTLMSAGSVLAIFLYLLIESWPVFERYGVSFVTGTDWFPGETYGAWPMLFGSVMVTAMALVWALPFALSAAIVTSELLSGPLRKNVKALMELLAGVPGIVYGLLGVTFLSTAVRDGFGLIDGNTIMTASLLLAMMVLPAIMTLSDDALQSVPGEYRDTALALGLTRYEMITRIVLPRALPGLAGAVFLGLGRAMGETIAVMLVIGGLDQVPDPWYDLFSPGQSIASKLGREAAEALGFGMHWNALVGLGLLLFLMVMVLSALGQTMLKKVRP